MNKRHPSQTKLFIHGAERRTAFTLIELLIVLSIALILMAMTAATFSYVRESDRVSSEAAKIQSYILGARDRAIYNDEMRGVRLFVEPGPPVAGAGDAFAFSRTVTAMAYIAPSGDYPRGVDHVNVYQLDGFVSGSPNGKIDGGKVDEGGDDLPVLVGNLSPRWWTLKRRGILVDDLRIRIPAGPAGDWYSIDTRLIDTTSPPDTEQFLILKLPHQKPTLVAGNEEPRVLPGIGTRLTKTWAEHQRYELELPPRILPTEPNLLADGVVIDLDGSAIPNIWRPPSSPTGQYSGYMDIWFSPRGNLIGEAAARGVLHFYVCDAEDSRFLREQFLSSLGGVTAYDTYLATAKSGGYTPFIPLDELPSSIGWLPGTSNYIVKDRRLVTLFSQTGGVTVNRVNAYVGEATLSADANGDGLADDPYRFAETGEVAK